MEIIGQFLSYTILRETERIPNMRFDLWGFLLSGSGLALLLYGLTYGVMNGWGTPHIVAEVGGGALLLVLWVVVELTDDAPLLDLRIFQNRTYSLATALTNVMRQVFSAFGTAIFATLLSTRQTYHQAMLSHAMTPYAPPGRTALASAQQMVLHNGGTPLQAQIAAVSALAKQVAVTASVMSFDDCFLAAAMLSLAALPIALVLRGTGIARGPQPGPMME